MRATYIRIMPDGGIRVNEGEVVPGSLLEEILEEDSFEVLMSDKSMERWEKLY